MKLQITPINSEAVSEGKWTSYRGVKLKIARSGNDEYSSLFNSLTKPYKFQLQKGTLDDNTMEDIMAEVIAKTILKDWKDFIVNNEKIDYSVANVISLVKNDIDCFSFIQEFSRDLENFLEEEVQETLEKSLTT